MNDSHLVGTALYDHVGDEVCNINQSNFCSDKIYCHQLNSANKTYSYQIQMGDISKYIHSDYQILLVTDDYIIIFEGKEMAMLIYEAETMNKVGKIDHYWLPTHYGLQAYHKNYLISFMPTCEDGTVITSIYDIKTCKRIFDKRFKCWHSYSFFYPYFAVGITDFSSGHLIIEIYDVITCDIKSPKPTYIHKLRCKDVISCRIYDSILYIHMMNGRIDFIDFIEKKILVSYETNYKKGHMYVNNHFMFIENDDSLDVYRIGNSK